MLNFFGIERNGIGNAPYVINRSNDVVSLITGPVCNVLLACFLHAGSFGCGAIMVRCDVNVPLGQSGTLHIVFGLK